MNALVLEGLLACLYVLSGSFEILTNLAMFVVWIFFIITVAGIFKLRKSFGHLKRTYHVPLYPFMPIVGIAGGLYIVISTIFNDAYTAGFGIAITLTGLPVYAMIKKKSKVIYSEIE